MQVGTTEMAGLLGITPRQLTSLRDQGVIPDAGRGQWNAAETFQAYVKHKVRSEVARSQRHSSDADDELKQLRVRRERRKEAVELRQLVPLEDAEFLGDQFAGLVRLHLNNLPARFTRDVEERERLQEHVDDVLETVAAGLRKCGEALRSGLDADLSEAPADGCDDD